ncbi:hypothetical protein BX257_9215 [Streptomyces sp. 3212.3]|nr:hypothetical protein BX257_9215 [Streptomyces sp. 3212.3]
MVLRPGQGLRGTGHEFVTPSGAVAWPFGQAQRGGERVPGVGDRDSALLGEQADVAVGAHAVRGYEQEPVEEVTTAFCSR